MNAPNITPFRSVDMEGKNSKGRICFISNDDTAVMSMKFIMAPIEMLLIGSSKNYSFTSDNEKAKDYIIDSKEVQVFDANNEAYENIYNNVYKAFDPGTKSIISV